jgi:hypothetical protein
MANMSLSSFITVTSMFGKGLLSGLIFRERYSRDPWMGPARLLKRGVPSSTTVRIYILIDWRSCTIVFVDVI